MIVEKSPAKINLFLHVIGRRQDGYHLLESLFAPLQLSDTIGISSSDEVSCTVDGAEIEDNIVIKAANLLKSELEVESGCKIHIAKNIPIGAGLGGGSSNAATVLKMLNAFWQLGLSQLQLEKYAIKLGADVPFFIGCKSAFLEGVGEKITPVTLGIELPILLINPNMHVSTKEVFQKGFSKFTPSIGANANMSELIFTGHNDLCANACEIALEIKNIIEFLKKQSGIKVARMSGAGSTCFGIFESIEDVYKARKAINHNWWNCIDLLRL